MEGGRLRGKEKKKGERWEGGMGKKGEKMLRHVCNKLEVEGWIFRSPFQRGKG